MLKEAMEFFLKRAAVTKFDVDGRQFVNQQVTEIEPCRTVPLKVHTLQAVVDFLSTNPPYPQDCLALHVVNPYRVDVLDGALDEVYRDREHYLPAERIHDEFAFGRWFDQEEMMINLMTLFEPSETLDQVKRVVAGLVSKMEVAIDDDG